MSAFATVTQFSKMLENLDAWLQKAIEHGKEKGYDAEILTHARLAPTQYALVQQVQSACDAAKYAAAYLSGQKAPSHPDTEKTIAELRARIRTCRDYIATFKSGDFVGAEERRVAPPWMEGKSVRGDAYFTRISTPNFYFHVAMAYAILRNNGIELGKRDYIGIQNWGELGE